MSAPTADGVAVRGKFIRSMPVDTHGTEHRYGCNLPGWTVERSSSIRGVSVARCIGCQAVELRTEARR